MTQEQTTEYIFYDVSIRETCCGACVYIATRLSAQAEIDSTLPHQQNTFPAEPHTAHSGHPVTTQVHIAIVSMSFRGAVPWGSHVPRYGLVVNWREVARALTLRRTITSACW